MTNSVSKKITILTIGTTGDVLPFIALALKLREVGHGVRLVTLKNFRALVESYGIEFCPIDMDIKEILNPDNASEVYKKDLFQQMINVQKILKAKLPLVFNETWEYSKGSDAIIFHPLIFNGRCLVEKLNVPGIIAIMSPAVVPTMEFASAGVTPANLGIFNRLTYTYTRISFLAYQSMINRWRKEVLNLKPDTLFVNMLRANGKQMPVLHSFSPALISTPKDWPETAVITGYWFLDQAKDWTPPEELVDFLNAGPPPIYAGFGSMGGNDPDKMTREVLEAIKISGQRCILATGWGGLKNIAVPESVYILDYAPHEWIFSKVSAVIHHGGAGTTGAVLRAGKPSVICPFMLDQYYWGDLLYKLGAGTKPVPQKNLSADKLAAAIQEATKNENIRQKAEELGQTINAEDGIKVAVDFINNYIENFQR